MVTNNIFLSSKHSDWVITECPINCDNCQQIWKNEVLCIKIICECKKCNHKKNIVLDEPCKPSNTNYSNHILNLTAEADTKYDYQ